LQSHYDVEPSEDGLSYTFTTKNKIRYKLALTIAPLGEVSAFSISLYPDEGYEPFPGLDFRIKNTISKIVGAILSVDSNTVFYVCDSLDGQEDKRHKVFEYWYDQCKHDHPYVSKITHQFTSINSYTINSTLLYNRENPLADHVIKWFKDAMNEM